MEQQVRSLPNSFCLRNRVSHVLEGIVPHRLLKVDGIEYFYLIPTTLEHFTTFLDYCTFSLGLSRR